LATLIITTQLHHRNNTISILALLTKWPGTVDTTGIVDKISILALLTDLELLTKWPVFLQNASGNPSLESAKSGPGYRLDYITVYTTKKMPHESTRSIRIYFEIFFKWSCIRVCHKGAAYFLPSVTVFSELVHKCRYCELHTTESVIDLNYQQLRLAYLILVCTG